jgi:3-hydroxybutyryl-CoA dehydrogenase
MTSGLTQDRSGGPHLCKRMAVVGAGVMGIGVANAFLVSGSEVRLVDVSTERVDSACSEIAEVVADGVRRGRLTEAEATDALARLSALTSIADLEFGLPLIVEAVPEKVELKHMVLAELEARTPRVLATNTGALPITELASGLRRPEAFIGMHFFNPVWSMPLVEVICGRETSNDTCDYTAAVASALGKQSIVVRDSPGFVTSRLGIALGLEAMRMLEDGVASASDIDLGMRLGYKHPVGPLYLTDLVGLDVRLDVARNLAATFGPRFSPPQLLVDLVKQGRLGKKSGVGFYEWVDGQPRDHAGSDTK